MESSTRNASSDSASFEVKVIFLRELATGYRNAREAEERLLKDLEDAHALEALLDYFHRIAGMAAQVGLPMLGHLAAVAERAVEAAQDGHFGKGADFISLISETLAGFAATLDEHGTGPVRQSRPVPATPATLTVPDFLGEGRQLAKVLVVDDDEYSAALIDHTLRSAGFMSSYCRDPREAIQRIEEELPDLIVLDVMMPEIDGFELCRRVRAHPAMHLTPIIFVTRKGDVEQRVQGLEVGGNDYIAKPFEPAELIARVRSHLQRLAVLREMAIRDGLTRCYNHKYFKMRLEQEMARAQRYGQHLSIALIDADHFKRVNDEHGHPAGDQVLSGLADIVHAAVRSTDVVARYGGEEFAVLMIHASVKEAEIVANRIRERVETHVFPSSSGTLLPGITVSIGVSEFRDGDTPASLLSRADVALYEAKHGGRNLVHTAA